nr:phage integrase N-terminal SAM-like domain-containing protein [Calidithermus terrae]
MRFHGKRHPKEMGVEEIRAYLSHLATEGNVAAPAQNVTLLALLFLHYQVLKVNLPGIENVVVDSIKALEALYRWGNTPVRSVYIGGAKAWPEPESTASRR